MSGTPGSGKKAHATMRERLGEKGYREWIKGVGRAGGVKKVPKGFAMTPKDELKEIAAKGGRNGHV